MEARRGYSAMPGIGISIFIGAVGAILRYAVTATAQGFDIHTAGVILMFVGGAGVVLSLLLWSSLSPFGGHTRSSRRSETTRTVDGRESAGKVVRETTDSTG